MIEKLFLFCALAVIASAQAASVANKENTGLGNWGLWSSYFPCNATCGGGIQRRMRFCSNHQHSNDLKCMKTDGVAGRIESDSKDCNTFACQGVPPQSCMNWHKECDNYAQKGRCVTEKGWMAEWCCKSCFELNSKKPQPTKASDGLWGAWTSYTKCDATCGGGSRIRTRRCDNPQASYGGLQCLKTGTTQRGLSDRQIQVCNTQACVDPIHGNWAVWTDFAKCDALCGGGQQIRSRTCSSPAPQNGGFKCETVQAKGRSLTEVQSRVCNTNTCLNKPTVTRTYPKQLVEVSGKQASAFCSASATTDFTLTWQKYKPDAVLSPHVKFFEKSNFTGKLHYKQKIMIFEKLSSQDTGLFACVAENKAGKSSGVIQVIIQVNGNWGKWQEWTDCSISPFQCGSGQLKRSRFCNSPPPSNGGQSCLLSDKSGKRAVIENEARACSRPCIEAGNWGSWKAYGACSKTCGGGEQSRSRNCDNPVPSRGGMLCLLDDNTGMRADTEASTQKCNITPCAVVAPVTSCEDKRPDCFGYAEASYCTKRPIYMSEYCCKTCKAIKTTPTPQKVISDPQTPKPEQQTPKPEQQTPKPEPQTPKPEPQTPKPEPPPQPPIVITEAPVETSCVDKNPDCISYAKANYCSQMAVLMAVHCCKTCKDWKTPQTTEAPQVVTTQPPVTTQRPVATQPTVTRQPAKSCADKRTDCFRYAENGYCSKRADYMSVNCCNTCKDYESRPRTTKPLIVDGAWGSWGRYSACNSECGGGSQRRLRYCNDPRASNGGEQCLLSDNSGRRGEVEGERRECNVQSCTSTAPRVTNATVLNAVKAKCTVNVGFVLDSSGTLKRDFYSAKKFMKKIAESFGVSRLGSRASVITFSYNAVHNIKFNDHYDVPSFNKALDTLPLIDSTTRIDLALRLAQKEMFEASNGAQSNMKKVLILLSDGAQTKRRGAEDPALIAEELRQAGVNILVVAIGGVINPRNLVRIAGHPSRVFYGKSFNELIEMNPIEDITQSTCYFVDPTVDCRGSMDVAFLLDSSGSNNSTFNAQKTLVKTLVATYGLSQDGTRAAVVTFSSDVRHSIRLNNYFKISAFNRAVDQLSLRGSTTMTDKALRFAEREVFERDNGARDSRVPNLLVLITHGSQTKYVGAESSVQISRTLRARGTDVLVIGLGSAIDAGSLAGIAGSRNKLFTVADHHQMLQTSFVQNILKVTCKAEPAKHGSIRRVCADNFDVCSSYVNFCRNYSKDWTDYMRRSCRKTCNYC